MSNWQEKICKVFILLVAASFLIPVAYADEITPYNQNQYQAMPVLNPNSWMAPPAVMPALPSSANTDSTGNATIGFTSGTLFRNQLSDLWAQVIYDGKVEYWDLDPGMLAFDGKGVNIQFSPLFDGKTLTMAFYGFYGNANRTAFTNPVQITVHSNPSNIAIPNLAPGGATDATGKIILNFTAGSLFVNQLNDLWAKVNYDNKTEYWDLDPGMLSFDGKSINMQFAPQFNGKLVKLEFYAFDKQGRQTALANPIDINVTSGPSNVAMPDLPASGTTDSNGKLAINFTSGSLSANQLNELWARVNYEGKTERWKLDPGMLAADGKTFNMQFEPKFNAKSLQLELFGFDKQGKQAAFSNPINISINSGASSVTIPNLPATTTTDTSNKAVINFVSGSLFAEELSGLRAHVSYEGKKEDWKLEPAMLADDGKSITLSLEPKFDNKTLNVDLYGFDNTGKQITPTNSVEITVNSGPNPIVMPALPASGATDVNGNIKIYFTSGNLAADELSDLWARLNYDGKTEHWKLGPSLLSGDGKSLSMQFENKFEGKAMKLELYAFAKAGKQTGFSSPIDITVTSLPSNLTMPTLPSGIKTNPNGNFTLNFLSGALLPDQLNDLWAKVSYEGKTEQWDLDPGMLSADGKAISLQIEPKLDGKTLKLELYAFDKQGKQTGLTNPIEIIVNSAPSDIAMPTLPATAATDVNGKAAINFTSGSLAVNELSDLWARVKYDNKIEQWDLDPAMLASDNKSLNIQFEPRLDGKILRLEFYAFDKQEKKTGFTNPIDITVNSSLSPIAMPTLTLNAATDSNGKVAINFTSGSLSANQLSELWAKVNYDNKSEFWKLQPGLLAEDSNSLNMKFAPQLKGKVLRLWLYGFDKNGKQTISTNPIEITVTP